MTASDRYDYKVIPAPRRGHKEKGVKTPEGRFALALEHTLNDSAAEGWSFHRAETLPSEERAGLTGTTTVFRSVLVFRRLRQTAAPAPAPDASPAASPVVPAPRKEPAVSRPATPAADTGLGALDDAAWSEARTETAPDSPSPDPAGRHQNP